MFYILLFLVVSLMLFIAQKCYERFPFLFWGIAYAAILLLAIAAGMRDNKVGIDVEFYALGTWQTLKNHMGDFIEANEHVRREGLYSLVSYLSAMVSDKFGFALFSIQFFMSFFVLHALKRYMHIVPLWLLMLVFNLYIYCCTLNFLAQGMASAFMLWSIKFFERRQFFPLLTCAVVCFFLHKSSVVPYALLFALMIFLSWKIETQKKMFIFVAIAGLCAFYLYLQILEYLSTTIPALEQMGYYGTESFKPNVKTMDMFLIVTVMAYVFIAKRKKWLDESEAIYISLFFLVDLFAQLLGLYNQEASRISVYFSFYCVVLLLVLIARSLKNIGTRTVAYSTIVLFMLFYCIRMYFIMNYGRCYPYSSVVLGV